MKRKIGLTVLLGLLLNCCVVWGSPENESLPPERFMQVARYRMTVQDSFADLRGKVTHMRRNRGRATYCPVRFAVRFGKDQLNARIVLNNQEIHELHRNYLSRAEDVKSNVELKESRLFSYGFKLEDLTMNFLSYPVKSELPRETVKTVKCRVLHLLSPAGEPVKVWISVEYFFPVKVEFYAPGSNLKSKPVRSMEITAFDKVNDYYVATEVALFSPDFRTRIAFDNCQVFKADSTQAEIEFKK